MKYLIQCLPVFLALSFCGMSVAEDNNFAKPIVLVAGKDGSTKIADILQCKTIEEAEQKAKKSGCDVVESKDFVLAFHRKSLGIDALKAKRDLLKGIAAASKDSDPPIIDFSKASQEMEKSLLWAWSRNSASSYIADPSNAKVYLVPSLRLTLQNGKRSAKYQWWGDPDDKKKEPLIQQITKEQADNPIKQKEIPASPIEASSENMKGVEFLFSATFVKDKLKYAAAKEAIDWLDRTSSNLNEQIDEAGQFLINTLMSPYCEAIWGESLADGADYAMIAKGGKDWFELQSREQYGVYGFANPDDARSFLHGSKIGKVEYFFDFCVTMKMPDGKNMTSSVQVRIK